MGDYTAPATFEKGEAKVRVTLVQHDGTWQILGLTVNSPLFAKPQS
jgi:hypothetical protein